MNEIEIISLLKKYKKVSIALNLLEDVNSFDEAILFVESNKIQKSIKRLSPKMNEKEEFFKITSNKDINLCKYLDNEIIKNKMDIVSYWLELDNNKKEKLKNLELNFIMYLITKKNDQYVKEKKKIITNIDMIVRSKQTQHSYDKLIV
jgi:hypothetical protein